MRAMSRIGGCSAHPECDTRARTSIGAPQRGQVPPPPSLAMRQYGQVEVLAAVGVDMWAAYSEPWWTYMDWMPTRPGPVTSARYMPWPMSPVLTFCLTVFMVTDESL